MVWPEAAPPRTSILESPSTMGWDAVMAWMVVIRPFYKASSESPWDPFMSASERPLIPVQKSSYLDAPFFVDVVLFGKSNSLNSITSSLPSHNHHNSTINHTTFTTFSKNTDVI